MAIKELFFSIFFVFPSDDFSMNLWQNLATSSFNEHFNKSVSDVVLDNTTENFEDHQVPLETFVNKLKFAKNQWQNDVKFFIGTEEDGENDKRLFYKSDIYTEEYEQKLKKGEKILLDIKKNLVNNIIKDLCKIDSKQRGASDSPASACK